MSQEEYMYHNGLADLYDKPYHETIAQYVGYWLKKREVSAYWQSQLTRKTQYRIVHLNNFVDIEYEIDSQLLVGFCLVHCHKVTFGILLHISVNLKIYFKNRKEFIFTVIWPQNLRIRIYTRAYK